MTDEEYEEDIARIRRANETFRSTVVEALNAVIARLDRENAELEERIRDLAVEEKLFDKVKQERSISGVMAANMQAHVDELERELRIVRRDRDALIQRADTAEKTLLNHGFNLHSMQRGGGKSGPIVGPAGTSRFPGVVGRGFDGGTVP